MMVTSQPNCIQLRSLSIYRGWPLLIELWSTVGLAGPTLPRAFSRNWYEELASANDPAGEELMWQLMAQWDIQHLETKKRMIMQCSWAKHWTLALC